MSYNQQEELASLPVIASTLGSLLAGKKGCSVSFEFGLQTACTNGREVKLPIFQELGTQEDADVIRCFLAHEICGHVQHSDFDALNNWAPSRTAFAKGICNIIEDGRIERAAWLEYVGVKGILHKGVEVLKGMDFFGPDKASSRDTQGLIQCLLLRFVRGSYLGQNLVWDSYETALKQAISPDVVDQIMKLALDGVKSGSTQEVCVATDAIMELLREEQKDQQKEKEKSDEESDSTDSEGDKGDSDSNENQEADSDETESSASDEDADESEGEGDGSGSGSGDSKKDAKKPKRKKQFVLDEDKSRKTDLSDAVEKLITTSPYVNTELPVYRVANDRIFIPDNGVMSASMKLSSKLEQSLLAVNDSGDEISNRGRLNTKKLVHAVMGSQNVFSTLGSEREGLSTAISVVIDNSGSMSGPNLDCALSSAFALCSSLAKFEGQGVRFEVLSFSESMRRVKGFKEPFSVVKNKFARIYAEDSTYMQSALLTICKTLIQQKERRKIAFFITDGDLGRDPSFLINEMSKAGIEVRLLFIGCHADSARDQALIANVKHWGLAQGSGDIVKGVFDAMNGAFVQ